MPTLSRLRPSLLPSNTLLSFLATAAEAAAHRDLAHPLLIYRLPFMRAVRTRRGEDTCVHTRPYTRTSLENVNFPGNYFLEKSHRLPRPCSRERVARPVTIGRERRENSDEILVADLHSSGCQTTRFGIYQLSIRLRCRFVLTTRKKRPPLKKFTTIYRSRF